MSWDMKRRLRGLVDGQISNELTTKGVRWTPYETHRTHHPFKNISLFYGYIRLGPDLHLQLPERVLRQYGYCHNIP